MTRKPLKNQPKPSGNPPERKAVPAAQVRAELLPDQSTALLQELHLLTRGGDLNADARRKLKQINHLCGMLSPALDALFESRPAPVLLDAGAGNAYLGFLLYDQVFGPRDRGEVLGVEVRPDLVERSRNRAQRLGFQRMAFVEAPVATLLDEARLGTVAGRRIDAVVTLHACDTATDDAIALGILAEAPVIAVVPCCQAEVSRLLSGGGAGQRGGLMTLWRHGLHRREFGAHLTNVIRGLVLEAHGYQVTVTELVGWEHSLKNELILARKHQRRNGAAIQQLRRLLADLPPLPMRLLATPGLPEDFREPGATPGAVDGSD